MLKSISVILCRLTNKGIKFTCQGALRCRTNQLINDAAILKEQ